jgi:hypothetical protein
VIGDEKGRRIEEDEAEGMEYGVEEELGMLAFWRFGI